MMTCESCAQGQILGFVTYAYVGHLRVFQMQSGIAARRSRRLRAPRFGVGAEASALIRELAHGRLIEKLIVERSPGLRHGDPAHFNVSVTAQFCRFRQSVEMAQRNGFRRAHGDIEAALDNRRPRRLYRDWNRLNVFIDNHPVARLWNRRVWMLAPPCRAKVSRSSMGPP